MDLKSNHLFNFLLQFDKTFEAYRGIRTGIALAVPLVIGRLMGYPDTGFYIGLTGVFFILGAVGGPYTMRAKTAIATLIGGTLAIGLGTLVSNIIWLKLVVTFLWMFAVGYAAVYGHPGIMTGIVTGILFLFTIHTPPGDLTVAGERMLIGCLGGIWAIALWLIFWPLQPYLPLKKAISNCYGAIADYMQLFLNNTPNAATPIQELEKITAWRETLQIAKDALVLNRRGRWGSSPIGQAIVILIQHIEQLMTSISTLVKLAKFDQDNPQQMTVGILVDHGIEQIIINLRNLARLTINQPATIDCQRLQRIAKSLEQQQLLQKQTIGDRIESYVNLVTISQLADIFNLSITLLERSSLILREMKLYGVKEKQTPLLGETVLLEMPKVPWFQPLQDNFTFNSAIFRHGLRLAIAISIGVAIATIDYIPREFWIVLTILLVLQQDFSSTFKRFFQRILGTFLGALLTPILTIFITQTSWLEAIAVISVSIAFSLLRFNYGVAVFFITVYAVLLEHTRSAEDAWIATGRVIATLIGSVIAFIAAFFLFRDRYDQKFLNSVENTIDCTRQYFQTVMAFYLGDQLVNPNAIAEKRYQNRLAQFNAQVSLQKLINDPQTSHQKIEIALTLMTNISQLSHTITALMYQLNQFSGTNAHPELKTLINRIDIGLEQLQTALKIKTLPPALPDLNTPLQGFKNHLKILQTNRLKEFANFQEQTPTRQILLDYSIVSLEIEEIAHYLQAIYEAISRYN